MAFVKFMRNKFFHPHTFENQKRTWIAEQNAENEKKKQEDLHKTYLKEQAIYENKNLLRTGKLTQDDKLAFMYEPPLECRKKDEKMELKEVRFEWQKNAPRTGDYARNLEVADCPFGIEVRNTKCIKCSVWGHMNTDKICPLYNQGMHNDENPSELGKEDPMVLLRAMETGGLKMRKGAVNSVMDVASNKYSLLEADKVDPEVAFIANLSDKQKRKLMKKLNKSSLGVGGAKKAKVKKHKKDKKKKKKKDNDSDDEKEEEKSASGPVAIRSDAPFPSRRRPAALAEQSIKKKEDPNYVRGKHTDPYQTTLLPKAAAASSRDEHARGPRIGERQPSRRSPRRSSPTPRHRSPKRNSPGRSPRRRSRQSPVKRSPVKQSPARRERSPAKRSPARSPKRPTKGKEVVRKRDRKESDSRISEHQGRKRHDTVESKEGRKRSNSDSRHRNSSPKRDHVKVEIKTSRRRKSSSSSSSQSPAKEKKVISLKVSKSKKQSSSSDSDSSRSPSPAKRSSKRSPVKEKKTEIKLKRSKKQSSSSSSDSSRSPSPVKRSAKKSEKKRHDSSSSDEKKSRKKR